MTAAIIVTGLGPLVALAIALAVWRGRRSWDFAATVARYHPELAAALEVDPGPVGHVAARAVDLPTPGAPRELAAGWELHSAEGGQ